MIWRIGAQQVKMRDRDTCIYGVYGVYGVYMVYGVYGGHSVYYALMQVIHPLPQWQGVQ
jgi:hypothetical protein